jgi:hypothetical protein
LSKIPKVNLTHPLFKAYERWQIALNNLRAQQAARGKIKAFGTASTMLAVQSYLYHVWFILVARTMNSFNLT